MDPARWKRIEEIYHAVLSAPPEYRAAELAVACSDDPALRDELESLLETRDEAGDFLSDSMRGHIMEDGFHAALPTPGEVLGSYRILAEAGAGSMGHVYRALDTRLEREVALKILPPHFARDIEYVARFRVEAKAVSTLNHPNIVTIYEIGQAAGTLFIATEWIEGTTLRERMAAGPVPLEATLDIAGQCAAGLAVAHRAGIIHRDIKPENVMIRCDGLVKLVDFGLARMNGTGSGLPEPTLTGRVMGTPRYMSPEQAKGQKLDARSDFFSLSAMLHELACGRPAFPGASAAEVFAELLSPEPVPAVCSASGLDRIIAKALEKDPGKRYATADEFAHDLKAVALNRPAAVADERTGRGARIPENGNFPAADPWRRSVVRAASQEFVERVRPGRRLTWRSAAIVAAVVLVSTAGFFALRRRQAVLSPSDTILLTDFVNQTGDPVFDVTLKQGLAVQLEQSPRLEVFPENRVRSRLQFMRRSPDEPVTDTIGREICQREGLKALVTGAIAPLGRHYAITLTAIDSVNGSVLAEAQAEAGGKERVLQALSKAASTLRGRLGESVRSLEKFDAMLDVTTPSLEALRAYSLGTRARAKDNYAEAIPLFRRAVELDPDFASAYLALAIAYNNTRQRELAAEAGRKAYALREHASERERLRILSEYYSAVTGNSEKRIEICRLQLQLYPRETAALSNLAVAYNSIGRFEEALEQIRAAVQQAPPSAARWGVLGVTLIRLGRFSEAADIYRQAFERHFDSRSFRQGLFRIAFVNRDQALMTKEVEWAERHGEEELALDWQGSAAAALGQRRKTGQFSDRLEALVSQDAGTEAAAALIAQAALRNAALGYCGKVKTEVSRAFDVERDVVSLTRGAVALAWCGEGREAESIIRELASEYPDDSAVNRIWVPAIKGAVAIRKGNPKQAVDDLGAARYEAAGEFWPQYLRGSAFLQLKRADEAAKEFRKILDHRGQDPISPLYPLAEFDLARVAMLKRDSAQRRIEAQRMYSGFLADWRNADSDVAALGEAKDAIAMLGSNSSFDHGSALP